jgi:hypothetical protein
MESSDHRAMSPELLAALIDSSRLNTAVERELLSYVGTGANTVLLSEHANSDERDAAVKILVFLRTGKFIPMDILLKFVELAHHREEYLGGTYQWTLASDTGRRLMISADRINLNMVASVYDTTEAYFRAEWPYLARRMGNESDYGMRVLQNTIPNHELVDLINGTHNLGDLAESFYQLLPYQTAVALMVGRLTGKIANPG